MLPSGSLRVVVFTGRDPLSGRRHYLREIILAGPKAGLRDGEAADLDYSLQPVQPPPGLSLGLSSAAYSSPPQVAAVSEPARQRVPERSRTSEGRT